VISLATMAAASDALAADKQVVALIQANEQALYFVQLGQGAEAEANKRGLQLVVFNANNDIAAQNNAVETYTQQKVAGIVIDALDRDSMMPAVRAAAAAGVFVSAVDTILPDGPQIAQVGIDSYAAGKQIGDYFVSYIAAHGGAAKVGIVGALNSSSQNERQKGFEDAVKLSNGVTMAGVVDGRNVQEAAMSAAENLITGNPDLTAIYATGEPALIGAAAAVESQGKQSKIKIFGWDLSAPAIKGLDAGYIVAVVQQDPTGMGAASVAAIADALGGKAPSKITVINVPVTIVTKDNVGPYRASFK
jgi:ribose transport system substrate-binding protein